MLVNENVLNELYNDIDKNVMNEANLLADEDRVVIKKVNYDNENNFSIKAIVSGNTNIYNTRIEIKDSELFDSTCECSDYKGNLHVCKHIAATLIAFIRDEEYNSLFDGNSKNGEFTNISDKQDGNATDDFFKNNKNGYKIYNQIIKDFYQNNTNSIIVSDNNKVAIESNLRYSNSKNELLASFRIGATSMYKLKNIEEFYERFKSNDKFKYGKNLEFIHNRNSFKESSQKTLSFILKYGEIFDYIKNSNQYYYVNNGEINLNRSKLEEFFEIYKGQELECESESALIKFNRVKFVDGNPNFKFEISEYSNTEYKIIPKNINIFKIKTIAGEKSTFLFDETTGYLYRCTKEFETTVLKLFNSFKDNFVDELIFRKIEFPNFLSVVFPKVKDSIIINGIDQKELEKYIPQDLAVKLYLDYDENNRIIGTVIFCYNDKEYNPFKGEKIDIPKNIAQENEALELLINTGFLMDQKNARIILVDEEKIFDFLNTEIEYYMSKFEVLVTDNFKNKEITRPKLSNVGIRVESNLLEVDLSNLNFDKKELKEIMHKYKLKKKYHRLKSGEFISLEQNDTLDFFENLETIEDLNYQALDEVVKLPIYRSMYLDRLLEILDSTEIEKSKDYETISNNTRKNEIINEYTLPNVNAVLRSYQKVGFNWLKGLDTYKLGGILADDMGLGKTLQIITLIASYIENNKSHFPSIVICPSSLALNWKNEFKKFAPNINVHTINGTMDKRKLQIENFANYDVIVTSYDLLKRDIEFYNENNCYFKYIIADEAQYIKNSNTQNSKSIKQLKADTRFALTGTPIENSLSELWSIFDFIVPGYLFTYKKFKDLFELNIVRDNDKKSVEKLKMLIEPFILRRIKKDVLTELPDKTISVLYNEMEEEQQKLYSLYMENAKEEALREIKENGLENSQIKILSLLMRLRQICCHPSLFLENYSGDSNKLQQCIEIIKDAVDGGHKILLFSSYTSMLDILDEELQKEKIKTYKLTGKTKVQDRIKLVDDFNNNDEIKVFLISLKAGGTGLNLTGADMVIHYDPWWNLSAENQATDRTYRIGQKRNVQVYKLITQNSIEERIYNLQNQKAELIDNVLTTGETFINKLSKEDILSLFR